MIVRIQNVGDVSFPDDMPQGQVEHHAARLHAQANSPQGDEPGLNDWPPELQRSTPGPQTSSPIETAIRFLEGDEAHSGTAMFLKVAQRFPQVLSLIEKYPKSAKLFQTKATVAKSKSPGDNPEAAREAKHVFIHASDGSIHSIPRHRIEDARRIDPDLRVVGQ